MNDNKETVTITKKEYQELLADSLFLSCLRSAGVDDWDRYYFAEEEFYQRSKNESRTD